MILPIVSCSDKLLITQPESHKIRRKSNLITCNRAFRPFPLYPLSISLSLQQLTWFTVARHLIFWFSRNSFTNPLRNHCLIPSSVIACYCSPFSTYVTGLATIVPWSHFPSISFYRFGKQHIIFLHTRLENNDLIDS